MDWLVYDYYHWWSIFGYGIIICLRIERPPESGYVVPTIPLKSYRGNVARRCIYGIICVRLVCLELRLCF